MKHHQQRQKYLRSRAVTSPWQLAGNTQRHYRAVVVIPALAESRSLPRTLMSLAANPAAFLTQTLIVVVVNNRSNAELMQRDDNQRALAWLATQAPPELQLAWIDAASPGLELPVKQGVGLARRIGFDAALACLDWQRAPLLVSLDADTLVDANYLAAIFDHFDQHAEGGAVIPFRHQSGDSRAQEAAIRDYELYLRSYQFGLERAGSPYAYHSIGSAFACTATAYLAAGGMNRRLAGEDFYFLQQLQKTTGVARLAGTIVRPAARFSARVPFGTGRVIQAQVLSNERSYQLIGVAGFEVLKQWLDLVTQYPEATAHELTQRAAAIDLQLAQYLYDCDFAGSYQRIYSHQPSAAMRIAAFHTWFDALRTRQLLTRFSADTDAGMEWIVAKLLAWGDYPEVVDKGGQLRLLEGLQGIYHSGFAA